MKTQKLTTEEAIAQRRSIRKFKSDPVPDELVMEVMEAARLAPSGSNAQPWRFKIVTDRETRQKLAEAAYHQSFIAQAPVVLVCCASIKGYMDGTLSGIQDLSTTGVLEERVTELVRSRIEKLKVVGVKAAIPCIALNVAIAIEHIVLRALDFGLGSCWVRLINEQMIKDLFGWSDDVYVVALLPLGYPDEAPTARKRRSIEELLLK
jgi:nitroreductase